MSRASVLGLPIGLLMALPTLGLAQPAPTNTGAGQGGDNIRAFLDCQVSGCDFDLTRREITWVDWVRDREDADVHVLVTSTASGAGTTYDLQFLGRGRFEGDHVTLAYTSSSTDTTDERRRALLDRFRLGLVRYAGTTPAAEFLRVRFDLPTIASSQVTPENDPWNLWVFTASVGGLFRGQSLTSSTSLNSSLAANRTSEEWKFSWGGRVNYSENEFTLSNDVVITSITRTLGTDALVVRSVGPRWGVGGRASLMSSTFNNQDAILTVRPAFEYNVFPYSESSRRQFTFRYEVGPSLVRYDEETIFGVTEETIWEESITSTLSLQQPWGSVSGSWSASHFLGGLGKNRLNVFGSANVRIVRGLSFNVFANVSRVRDQVFLPRRGASDEEVLLQRRALQTDFDYLFNFSIRYTFGSIFNNIVNPRFGGGGGGTFVIIG